MCRQLPNDMTRPAIQIVIEAHPEMASAVRRLYLADQSFRDLCQDFAAAQATLGGLATHPAHESRPEVVEYRRLVLDLD